MSAFDRSQFTDILTNGCADFEVSLSPAQNTQLLDYLETFIKWNQAYNLSAIRDPLEMLHKHLLDSLSVLPTLQNHHFERVADVGTGGGLPGIPLAICLPDKKFTLIDTAGKKTRFLQQTTHQMRLKNVNVENCRVENYRAEPAVDVVISRAFAAIDDMISACEHLLTESGEFWAMKGVFPEQELSRLPSCYKVVSCSEIRVPGDIGERCLVRIKKES